jgi:hypothetical protein
MLVFLSNVNVFRDARDIVFVHLHGSVNNVLGIDIVVMIHVAKITNHWIRGVRWRGWQGLVHGRFGMFHFSIDRCDSRRRGRNRGFLL